MKIALTLAAGLLAASSMAFAADNNGGGNNNGGKDGMKDNMTTGSVNDNRPDMEDAEKCRDHVAGGAPCQEPGTTMDMQ